MLIGISNLATTFVLQLRTVRCFGHEIESQVLFNGTSSIRPFIAANILTSVRITVLHDTMLQTHIVSRLLL